MQSFIQHFRLVTAVVTVPTKHPRLECILHILWFSRFLGSKTMVLVNSNTGYITRGILALFWRSLFFCYSNRRNCYSELNWSVCALILDLRNPTQMRLVTRKRLVFSFALVVGVIVLYIITSEHMKCSELNFLPKCLSFSEITNDKLAQEAARKSSPISLGDPVQ